MPRLLLINEPRLFAELDRSFVRRRGFTLVLARDGNGLLEEARADRADLVIARSEMADMAGAELCTRLRGDPATAATPILLLGRDADRDRAKLAGANAFLPIPWTRSQLLSAIHSILPAPERRADRAQVSLRVLCGAGRTSYIAFTRDISSNGLFLKGASLAGPGETVRIRLAVPAGLTRIEFDMAGEIVREAGPAPTAASRHGSCPGVGVRILDLPLGRRLPLARFVREQVAR